MDPETRLTQLEEALHAFLDTREDAIWLYENVRREVKQAYPDIQLSQRNPDPDSEELNSHISNDSSRIQGNELRLLKVRYICLSKLIISEFADSHMGDESEAVKNMIRVGATAGHDINTIKKAVQLLKFLRSADATVDCLRMIRLWRTHSLTKTLAPVDDGQETIIMVDRLIEKHVSLENAGMQCKVLRRLNCLHLTNALLRLDSNLKLARVSMPRYHR